MAENSPVAGQLTFFRQRVAEVALSPTQNYTARVLRVKQSEPVKPVISARGRQDDANSINAQTRSARHPKAVGAVRRTASVRPLSV